MKTRAEIIKAFECCGTENLHCRECPYAKPTTSRQNCEQRNRDAMELLRRDEQLLGQAYAALTLSRGTMLDAAEKLQALNGGH